VTPITDLAAVARRMAGGDLSVRARSLRRDETGELAEAYNNMADQIEELVGGLEQTVADRTRDLEQRSAYLEATADVGRAAASMLAADQLSREVVELIRERFGLYYVGLFLVDEAREWAVLRAGTGQAGRALLARGHRIQVGEGMIGWSVAQGQSRVAQLAEEDAVRLATAELPDTRSEAALPLRSRGRVLGALSVQHTQPGVFDEDTMAVLQTMADQVAVALENARLFTESQAALESAQRAYGELSRGAWNELLRPRADWGYRYTQQTVTPVEGVWRPEMLQAGQTGEIARGGGNGDSTLAIPLKVRDQVVGVLGFRKGEGDAWTDEEAELLESFVAQLEAALESARLYQETQQRAVQEQLTSEITARMRETLDVDTVLRTAIREMGTVLGIPRVEVRMATGRTQARLERE
jgi:GAF domain-containing protein